MNGYTGALIGSYVCHPESGTWWNVSTISRESSAMLDPLGIYDETIVWEWDAKTKDRGALLVTREGGLRLHFELCRHLHEHGEMPTEDDDE